MKSFCSFLVFSFLSSSFLIGESHQISPFSTAGYGILLEKNLHRGPRGHRGLPGHRGHRGHQGEQGLPGKCFDPAYIDLSFIGPAMTISPQDGLTTIIPFGINDTSKPPILLEYYDADPTSPTADRYIRVLPGGDGLYLIEFSIYAQTNNYTGQAEVPLQIQPQFDFGAGWDATYPYNVFQTVFTASGPSGPAYYSSSGTATGAVYLTEGNRFRAVVLSATQNLCIGLSSLSALQSRDVQVSMRRIDTPS